MYTGTPMQRKRSIASSPLRIFFEGTSTVLSVSARTRRGPGAGVMLASVNVLLFNTRMYECKHYQSRIHFLLRLGRPENRRVLSSGKPGNSRPPTRKLMPTQGKISQVRQNNGDGDIAIFFFQFWAGSPRFGWS